MFGELPWRFVTHLSGVQANQGRRQYVTVGCGMAPMHHPTHSRGPAVPEPLGSAAQPSAATLFNKPTLSNHQPSTAPLSEGHRASQLALFPVDMQNMFGFNTYSHRLFLSFALSLSISCSLSLSLFAFIPSCHSR